jgi:hypothetical protein
MAVVVLDQRLCGYLKRKSRENVSQIETELKTVLIDPRNRFAVDSAIQEYVSQVLIPLLSQQITFDISETCCRKEFYRRQGALYR